MPEMASANSNNVAVVNGGCGGNHQFGDTTLTKLFVGGLAWETPKDAMREHFQRYGDILEAVIISDKVTGRSKGYGFVTFKEAEAAKKACEDPTPIINGRRANCNLASLGARRPSRSTNNSPPRQQGSNGGGPRSAQNAPPPPANHAPWYYPVGTPASHFHHHHHHQPVPLYGYTPTYIPTDINYNQKPGYSGGGPYMNGYYSPMYPSQAMVGGNTLMPMYPLYQYHQTHTMGLPAHIFQPTTTGHVAIMSKPASMTPNTGVVGRGEGLKKVG